MKLVGLIFILILSLPGFTQEDDGIDQLQKIKRKQHEKMQELMLKHDSASTASPSNLPPEIQALGYKELSVSALSDERVVKQLKKMFESSPFISMTDKEVRVLLLDKVKGGALEGFFQNNPKVVACLVDILKNKMALSSFLGILLRWTDLVLYTLIWICFMLMGRCLKKILLIEEMGLFKRTLVGLIVSFSVMSASIYSFYKIFEKELSPVVTIVFEHLENRHT